MAENKKLQNLAEPTTFNDPAMPSQEPRSRQGINPGRDDFHLPEYQRGKYWKVSPTIVSCVFPMPLSFNFSLISLSLPPLQDWEKETKQQQIEVEEARRRVLEAEQRLKEAKEKQGEVVTGVTGGSREGGEARAPDSRPSDARYHHDVYSEHHPPYHEGEGRGWAGHHEEALDPLDASFMHGEVSRGSSQL